MNDITERKYHDKQLAYLANHDTLTDLPNRNLFHDRLKQAIAFHDRGNKYAAVLFIDLDHFKIVNDTFGHQKGDLLLLAVTNRLDSCIRKSDTLARFGGDKFCILLGNLSKNEDVVPVINKISNAFIPVFKFNDVEIFITASIGISIFPADGDDPDQLLKNAETAMYHAKGEGRNTYQFFSSEMNNRVFERLSLETSLHKALEKTEFLLHYQPTVDVATNRIVGMEALVRWNHPEMGLVPPGRFISHAEESGLIVPIGEWVLKTACKQNKEWQEKGCPPLRVAVNLSARQFKQKNLVQMVARVLEETQLEPRWLELEITESVVMQNPEETIKILEELKQMGIELAIDDFGTGYSSLSYLKRFPLKILKIDQSFVRDVTNDEDDATIVKAIIAMAHGLGMKVIAEGVETAEQLAFLATYNCEEIQGYYFSKPLSADMFEKLIR